MSDEKCSTWLNGYARWVLAVVTILGGVAAFAWASQTEQNERLRKHDVAIAVMSQRLETIDEKLGEIRDILTKTKRR